MNNTLPSYIPEHKPVLLCIDDDAEDRELFRDAIDAIGFDCTCMMSENALEALAVMQTLVPDYIFLDINMPQTNGRAMLEMIRRDKRFDPITICMLSTSITPEDVSDFVRLGANACLVKPHSFKTLCHSLTAFFTDTKTILTTKR